MNFFTIGQNKEGYFESQKQKPEDIEKEKKKQMVQDMMHSPHEKEEMTEEEV